VGKRATFQATSISLGEDLKRIALQGFTLAFPLSALQVQVHAKQATLSGLPPWGRSRRLPIALRVCLFAISAGISAYVVGRLVTLRPWLPAWAGALIGALVSACLWWATAWLERQEPSPAAYLAVPAAGLFGTLLVGFSLLGLSRLRFGRGTGTLPGP
jgi:CDP-diglyceride synthetase